MIDKKGRTIMFDMPDDFLKLLSIATDFTKITNEIGEKENKEYDEESAKRYHERLMELKERLDRTKKE